MNPVDIIIGLCVLLACGLVLHRILKRGSGCVGCSEAAHCSVDSPKSCPLCAASLQKAEIAAATSAAQLKKSVQSEASFASGNQAETSRCDCSTKHS